MSRRLLTRGWWRMHLRIRPHSADAPGRRFTIAEIDRALLRLPERERAVYRNHRNGGLSYATIAVRLGISIDEVERIMARAIFALIQACDAIERERR